MPPGDVDGVPSQRRDVSYHSRHAESALEYNGERARWQTVSDHFQVDEDQCIVVGGPCGSFLSFTPHALLKKHRLAAISYFPTLIPVLRMFEIANEPSHLLMPLDQSPQRQQELLTIFPRYDWK